MSRKNLLLTGSCGFIGSNFIRKSIYDKCPYQLFSVDKIASSSMLNNIYQHKIHEFYVADICDEHIMDKIFEYVKPQIVINMAAESAVDKSISDPNIFVKSNIFGTQNMINLSIKYGVDVFFQISTDETYGALQDKNDPLWDENSPVNPLNPYSATKCAAELIVKAAHNTHKIPYFISRGSNTYGMRQTSNKLIPRIIKSIMNNETIKIYGNGTQIRDWLHVSDHCSAILKILDKGTACETYNISANEEFSNLEIAQTICDIMGDGKIEFVKDRPGHDFRYGINSSKLRNLGWRPVYKFKDGIKNVIEWFQINKWFLDNN